MGGAFKQIKDIYKLQKEAREMQKKMKNIHVTGKSDDELVVVSINGTQEVEDITIEDRLLSPSEKKLLVKGIKQALKDAQKKLQKELMKDMDLGQLKGMLGG
ncbi:MAG: YbaB/EbfC family nucleoid-associated protein [Candidatus Dojkabacteria bacterium]|uniref:YbaB/EbfC family nucleoid-associated protein n=1 Tax=Candidatus Dojkabacteria bacterium TaxID=2099670 RepID=A0A952DV49_9BACT|nr:YbaB/EbfC family nucleoid-associated protein [Candidatus Dojkabacteria bacterium]WKZ28396.1 MAG: YbaB/EbfC family nucleoid-associated protein [Candidatus Dojkabacteria bacterium]